MLLRFWPLRLKWAPYGFDSVPTQGQILQAMILGVCSLPTADALSTCDALGRLCFLRQQKTDHRGGQGGGKQTQLAVSNQKPLYGN